jgi:hypothetical protein
VSAHRKSCARDATAAHKASKILGNKCIVRQCKLSSVSTSGCQHRFSPFLTACVGSVRMGLCAMSLQMSSQAQLLKYSTLNEHRKPYLSIANLPSI